MLLRICWCCCREYAGALQRDMAERAAQPAARSMEEAPIPGGLQAAWQWVVAKLTALWAVIGSKCSQAWGWFIHWTCVLGEQVKNLFFRSSRS
jgi:hypothetical protein